MLSREELDASWVSSSLNLREICCVCMMWVESGVHAVGMCFSKILIDHKYFILFGGVRKGRTLPVALGKHSKMSNSEFRIVVIRGSNQKLFSNLL